MPKPMHTNTFSSFMCTNTFSLIYLMNQNPNSFLFFFFFQVNRPFHLQHQTSSMKAKEFLFFFFLEVKEFSFLECGYSTVKYFLPTAV